MPVIQFANTNNISDNDDEVRVKTAQAIVANFKVDQIIEEYKTQKS